MSANVETMYYVSNAENERFVPWHGLGTPVESALNSKEALEMSGLDWEVKSSDLYTNGMLVPDYVANVRSTDNSILGIVSKRYKIVQNKEAFAFTDELIGNEVRYETAGSLNKGKRIWLLAKMKQTDILGDKVDPYLCFTNAHDGTGAVQVCMTPIRVVCNNTLNLALSQASRKWSTRHIGDLAYKLEEAKNTLQMANSYMTKLNETADQLANTKMTDGQVEQVLNELFPIGENDSDRKKNNVEKAKEDFYVCWYAPDILQFRNTQWGFMNAMSDFVTHNKPQRASDTYAEKNWNRIIDGHILMDNAMVQLAKVAG